MQSKTWNRDYEELLVHSNLPTLQARWQQSKLCQLYKIINGTTFFPEAPTQTRQYRYSSRTVHNRTLVPLHSRSLQFQSSFFPSSIKAWNFLPEDVESSPTFLGFKHHLKNNWYAIVFVIMSCLYCTYSTLLVCIKHGYMLVLAF